MSPQTARLLKQLREAHIRAEARDEQLKAQALTMTLDEMRAAGMPSSIIGWVGAERNGWHTPGTDLTPWTR